ncbi:acyl-CoA dehydrogenase family protein [Pseudonocardia aurantiaca]|uniref:Acyl-CoA dehydrogenase family protein n=1 Tax=Pseudonocardia aurantiaca TaxID=75290 RepID=A0ABW4FRX9_9PSEU
MYLSYTDEQLRLQQEIRAYFGELIPPDAEAAMTEEGGHDGPVTRRIRQRMGDDGWLGVGWPKEYGGRSLSALEQFIFFDEANRAKAPLPLIALNTVGPTLMHYGTEEQKRRHLPAILSGREDWAIGYSEPSAGTDLAALTTKAVRDGDNYVIQGSKVFTSGGDTADFIWLAARTGLTEARHRGISVFIVPTSSPGFSAVPLHVVGGGHTTFSYYEDVRVPAENLVLGENQGWTLITSQLNHERVALAANAGRWFRLFDDVLDWSRQTKMGSGERVIDLSWVQLLLGRAHAMIEAVKLANWRMAAALNAGELTASDSSAAKVLGTEAHQEVARLLLEILGQAGYLRSGSPGSVLRGRLENEYRSAIVGTFGGGNNEIQREIIAWTGLGMPRGGR